MQSLREFIRDETRTHLENNGVLLSQCIQAVGWIAGTVPQMPNGKGLIELPTSDVSNGGVVTGLALGGRRPIYVIRYQGFITYNGASIFNYAAKSKAVWGIPCPLFVRAIAMEKSIGPVATGSHHSLAMRYPGIKVVAPMTIDEWSWCWHDFMHGDDPVYCSEHRSSYDSVDPDNSINRGSTTTVVGISAGRTGAKEAAEKTSSNYIPLFRLKPLFFEESDMQILRDSDTIVVVDSDYQICGASEHICMELSKTISAKYLPIGVKDQTAGFSPLCDVLTPTASEIIPLIENNKNWLDYL